MDKNWIRAALIRATKTVAQTAAAMIGTAAVIESVDWRLVASASALAGILSLLTSVAGLPEVSGRYVSVEHAYGGEAIEDDEIQHELNDPED